MCSHSAAFVTHNHPALVVEGVNFMTQRLLELVVTYLILEGSVPDIFSQSGRSQNITRTFLIALGIGAAVKHVPVVPDQPEC